METSNLIYGLWLNSICNHSPKLIFNCVNYIGTAKEIFDGNVDKEKLRKLLGSRYNDYLKKDLSDAKEIAEFCDQEDINIIHIDYPEYPSLLRNIDMPPQILYLKGKSFDLNDYLTISIVGTRKCSSPSRKFTMRLGYELGASGIIVVSGMALGIDRSAQIGALESGQKTVAVLAGGVNNVYPKANQDLYDKILENGMIISERPPESVGRPEYYQERNRIIAGLSFGTVVVEGPKRSGTSITMNFAQHYNRDVFAVPVSPYEINSYVPNMLLRDGAICVLCADDIVEEYKDVYHELLYNGQDLLENEPMSADAVYGNEYVYRNKPDDLSSDAYVADREYNIDKSPKLDKKKAEVNLKKHKPKLDISGLGKGEAKVLEYLYNCVEPAHIDEIMRDAELTPSEIGSIMMMLQMRNRITQYAGNIYTFKS